MKMKSLNHRELVFLHKRERHSDVYITNGQQLLFYINNIHEIDGELTPARMLTNIWADIAWEGIAGEGGIRFPRAKKPERLVRRCLQLTTKPGDIVLDSFLGSGSTAAVAHKMGRRYIGIEMGEHAVTHCVPRLQEGDRGGAGRYFQERRVAGRRGISLLPSRPARIRRTRPDSPGCPLPHTGRAYMVLRNQAPLEQQRRVAFARSARRPRLCITVQRSSW